MKKQIQFYNDIQKVLYEIGRDVFDYDQSEFWMIQSTFEYVEFYAVQHQYPNTMIALNLARGLHNGCHRKLSVIKDGLSYRYPYCIHPLLVCRMLMDMHIPLSPKEEDILLAAALCHDMIEDIDFKEHGKELYKKFHLDPRVYEIVKIVSKRKDFTEEEVKAHFHSIESNELALLVKLADRGHNVEDLYNMKLWKVHEYVEETNTYFLPMCEYALKNYPERKRSFEILQDKIVTLTTVAKELVDRYNEQEQCLQRQIEELRHENEKLRIELANRWKD